MAWRVNLWIDRDAKVVEFCFFMFQFSTFADYIFSSFHPGPSERFLVVRSRRTPSAAARAWCPRWSTAPAGATSEIWPWAAVRGRAPATRTLWPCFRRKAASLPAEEPESLLWSFWKAQTRWHGGSQSFQAPRRQPAREETQHLGMENQTINERKYR